jgi:type IV secretory pathway TraG/TraD family ATPase VirD4
LLIAFTVLGRILSSGLPSLLGLSLHTVLTVALVPLGIASVALIWHAVSVAPRLLTRYASTPPPASTRTVPVPVDRSGHVQRPHQRQLRVGFGAYLGVAKGGALVTADPEHGVLVLGPPRSGKTSCIVIPAIVASEGPVLSTATKRDVMDATWQARSEVGQVWLFDPSGEHQELPRAIRRLSWSPVAAASTWDSALLMARAMASTADAGKGTTNEGHWRERSAALIAPLLYAASLQGKSITDVLGWVLRADLDPAGKTLEAHEAQVACDVLVGIAKTDERERSSIFSAAAGVLAAYNSDAARRAAGAPNFDPARFVDSTDTVYITAPAHRQALCAPLVVGLLEQIRHATYARAAAQPRPGQPPVFVCLDEVANIAPIPDLPALVSEAGGQGLHVLACLQDLSQARSRWGDGVADGLLSLFQTKVILSGIADARTLEALSVVLGEYDRHVVSETHGQSRADELFTPYTDSESVTYSTARQRTLPPGEIAKLPAGHGLLLRGTDWGLLRLTPWYR